MRKEVLVLALALVVLSGVVSAKTAPLITNLDNEILVCESSDFSLEFDKLNGHHVSKTSFRWSGTENRRGERI